MHHSVPTLETVVRKAMQSHGGESWKAGSQENLNEVAFVCSEDEPQYVVKVFTRQDNFSMAQAIAEAESHALQAIEGSTDKCPVSVPSLIETNDTQWPYNVVSHLPGETISLEELRGLPDQARESIGRKLGQFAGWLSASVPYDKAKSIHYGLIRSKLFTPDKDWEFEALQGYKHPSLPIFSSFVTELLQTYERLYPDGITKASHVAIHGDLRVENLLFSDGELTGVIDFGSLRTGEHGEDARPLYHLGRVGVNAFGRELHEQGLPRITFEHARLWLLTNFTAGIIQAIRDQDTGKIRRLTGFLRSYSPDRNWNELDNLSKSVQQIRVSDSQ